MTNVDCEASESTYSRNDEVEARFRSITQLHLVAAWALKKFQASPAMTSRQGDVGIFRLWRNQ
jgi:hypothetical protein